MAAVFNFLGVFVMTLLIAAAAETITKMVDFDSDPDQAIIALTAALFAIVTWASLAWVLTILFWREIFDKLEACADACEHVGDSITTVVMKNT